MESLPVEMVEKLSSGSLDERDLLACSAVCRDWWRIFSYDSIWKPRCRQKKTLELDDHLRSTPCVVEPPFAFPEAEVGETGSPSGHKNRWKLAYFREKHIWNNWRKGKSKDLEVTRIPLDYSKPKNIGFLSDDLVYIMFCNHYEVWNVRNVPAVQISESAHINTLTDSEVFSFTVFGENQSLGFTIDHKTCIRTFGLDPMSGAILELATFEYASPTRTNLFFDNYYRFAILGTTFIGIVKGTTTLHIWDLERCTKLKEEQLDSSQPLLYLFSNSEVIDAVVVVSTCNVPDMTGADDPNVDYNDHLVYIFQVYSFTAGRLLDFRAVSKPTRLCLSALLKDFIAIADTEFRVFNVHTSELVYHLLLEDSDPDEGWIVCCTVGQYFYHSEGYFDPVNKSDCISVTGTVEGVVPLRQLRALGKSCCVESFTGFSFEGHNIFCDLQEHKLNIMGINDFPKNGDSIRINPSCSRLFYYHETESLVEKPSSKTGGNDVKNMDEVFKIKQFW